MCGIAGIIHFNGTAVSLETVRNMTKRIAHRGPDGEGHWLNPSATAGLGHRRLSIIDLSENASQPMHYMNKRYTITYNGEIYNYLELKADLKKHNYQFTSASDTEVILALYDRYKEDCVRYLDGMFSFVLWDEQQQAAFCARDRFGEKPFFYYLDEQRFVFASEIKSLWPAGVDKSIDHHILSNFLADKRCLYDHTEPGRTFYSHIRRLGPATTLYIKNGKAVLRNYWKNELKQRSQAKLSVEDASVQLAALVTDSVKKRLRSDVPVGSSLSGGIDSSVIVCIIDSLKQGNAKQLTFSARFPGFEKDEGRFMEMIAHRTSADARYVFPDQAVLAEDIEQLFYHQEEPTSGASLFAQWSVMKLAKENNTTVLLDGQGADELLAGYHHYYYTYYYDLLKTDKKRFDEEIQLIEHRYPLIFKHFSPYISQKRNTGFVARTLSRVKKNITSAYAQKAGMTPASHLTKEFQAIRPVYMPEFDTLNEQLHFNTHSWGLQDLLRFADRNSMAHGREVRLPFLDHKIAEFAFHLPAHYKIHKGWTKYILRRGFEDLLPREIAWREDKVGYEPPQKKWMEFPRIDELYKESAFKLEKEGILNPRRNKGADDKWVLMSAAYLFN